jgi:hypothetical protein
VIGAGFQDSWKNVYSATCISEEELVFLKAHLINQPPTALRQLKRDITAEKKSREAGTVAKAPGSGEKPTGLCSGHQSCPTGDKYAPSQKAECKRKANELDSSNPGGSLEPATRRPAPGLSAPLHAETDGPKIALGPGATPTGEQAAKSRRQLGYAEVRAVYARKPVKGSSAGVDTLALPLLKTGPPRRVNEEGTWNRSAKHPPPETKSHREEKDTTVSPIAGGLLIAHPAAPKKPSGSLKPTAKGSCNVSVPAASV